MIFNMGGGGAGLGFRVLATSAATVPAGFSGVENDILIVGISAAGATPAVYRDWEMQAVAPLSASEGNVWIASGPVSRNPIAVVKNKPLFVYPNHVMCYESGIWVRKAAYCYKSGVWEPFEQPILPPTTGWNGIAASGAQPYFENDPNTGYPAIRFQTSNSNSAARVTNGIDLTPYTRVRAYFKNYGTGTNFSVRLAALLDADKGKDCSTAAWTNYGVTVSGTTGDILAEYDVSLVNEVRFIGVGVRVTTNNVYCAEVTLE